MANVKPAAIAIAALGVSINLAAAPVDLSTWTAESYTAVGGFPPGNWVVGGGGSFVTQQNNGQPTIFYSPFSAQNSDVRGRIRVDTSVDDDYVGFVLGFNPGDSTNASADFLLIDWKQLDQFFNFTGNAATNATPGTDAFEGLAVSRVTGTPSADELWGHVDLPENAGGGATELERGATLDGTGWDDFVEYEFRFIYTPTSLRVFVDDVLQIDIAGSFPDGRLGFYNFSQSDVVYDAFTIDPAPTPEPGTLLLVVLGLAGALRVRRSIRR
jgi:hypothetical protein